MNKYITLTLFICFVLLGCSPKEEKKIFGDELNEDGIQLFYTENINKEQAEQLLKFLIKSEFAKDGSKKTVQLNKNDNTYEFRMVVKKGIEQDQEYIEIAKNFGLTLSRSVFENAQVDVHFCDELLETIRVIPMKYVSNQSKIKSHKSQTVDQKSAMNQNYSQNSYPKDLVQNFMNECMKNGGSQTRCSCALNKIEEKYSLSEYLEFENAMINNNTPKEFLNFIQSVQTECSEQ